MSSLLDINLLSKIKALGNYTEEIRLTKYEKEGIVSVLMHKKRLQPRKQMELSLNVSPSLPQ